MRRLFKNPVVWFALTTAPIVGRMCYRISEHDARKSIINHEPLQEIPPAFHQALPTHIFTDHASYEVARSCLPNEEDVLTPYLRYTMTEFSDLPQAWLMKTFMLRSDTEAQKTFTAEHIKKLKFIEGDIVNGVYRVKQREPNLVFLEMIQLPGMHSIFGQLAIGILESKDKQRVRFFSRTTQWSEDATVVLPLQRMAIRWMHEYASHKLLVDGVHHLRMHAGSGM